MRCLLLLVSAAIAFAQVKVTNPGFENGELGSIPTGWRVPQVLADAGFGVKLTDAGCRSGKCAMMSGVAKPPQGMFGNLMQVLPANGYQLRHIRLRAALRVEGEATRAQMWLRLDRADGSMVFLENMDRRPVVATEWKTYDIETNVPEDVGQLVFGFMLFGGGSSWVDDVSLDILDEVHKDTAEAPRPLTGQGLTNVTAFARLYGYVRFFHPSDQAAAADWETVAVDGVREVEGAATSAELVQRLRKVFAPIAPTVEIFATGKRPGLASVVMGPETVHYEHHGVGLATSVATYSPYSSKRVRKPRSDQKVPKPFEAEVAPGVSVSVPLAVYADPEGTLPHLPMPANLLYSRTASDRATRLAAVTIAWNVFQHFYPYFDVVKTNWMAELPKSLQSAAVDTGPEEFHKTLRRLVADLHDGHGSVGSPFAGSGLQPPITMDWVEGQFVVTRVQKGRSEGVAPGDRVLKIDGKPIEQAWSELRPLISGATEQWIRWRGAGELSQCKTGTRQMTLELEPFGAPGTSKTVELACMPPRYKDMESYTEPRPEKITELEPGIMYVDLDRITDADWTEVAPRLAKAKGIIFDMRGYPGQPAISALAHLTDNTIRSAKWNVASAALPDRLDSPYTESGWPVPPQKPYFSAKRVFLTDGRAISYAETVMGIVEAFKLAEIVGEPTAGTNGNVNPFKLPGGYTVSWTGMKVLKHDGSQHHGIGILPTVPASRTRKGVAEGKDEILLRGLEVVKGKATNQ